jgi:hypothetical protein
MNSAITLGGGESFAYPSWLLILCASIAIGSLVYVTTSIQYARAVAFGEDLFKLYANIATQLNQEKKDIQRSK